MDRDQDFGAYVEARWSGLVRATVLLGCSRQDAEDLVQVALERCYQAWDRVRGAREPDAYVYTVLVHCLASSRRRRWWGEQPSAHPPDDAAAVTAADDVAADTSERRMVLGALSALELDHRTVLVLRYYADLSEQQVADVLGVATGTVKSRTSRALKRLALELEGSSPRSSS